MMRPALAVIAALVVHVPSPAVAATWWSLDESRKFAGATGSAVQVTVLTIDLTKANLRVISVPFEAGTSLGSTELSVKEFAQVLATQSRYRGKEWIVVNGGFSSYRVDVPLGLLVVQGKVYSTLTRERPRAPVASPSEYSQYRWSGVLCQSQSGGTWDIVPAARYAPGLCRQALQAGPVPVEPTAKVGIAPGEAKTDRAYLRTVLCIVNESTMKVAITRNETHLLPMANWMARSESAGGLGCRVALNLSGDSSSGLAVNAPGRKSPTLVGDGTFPIPTALLFESK